jgi:hypothetical protein
MSALGQKPTFAAQEGMSALPPIATSIAFFGMSALGHVWTAPGWQELFSRCSIGRCGHVFGLLVRYLFPLAIMPFADQVPVSSSHSIDALAQVGCPDRWIATGAWLKAKQRYPQRQ